MCLVHGGGFHEFWTLAGDAFFQHAVWGCDPPEGYVVANMFRYSHLWTPSDVIRLPSTGWWNHVYISIKWIQSSEWKYMTLFWYQESLTKWSNLNGFTKTKVDCVYTSWLARWNCIMILYLVHVQIMYLMISTWSADHSFSTPWVKISEKNEMISERLWIKIFFRNMGSVPYLLSDFCNIYKKKINFFQTVQSVHALDVFFSLLKNGLVLGNPESDAAGCGYTADACNRFSMHPSQQCTRDLPENKKGFN